MYGQIQAVKTIVNYFATQTNHYMKDEDKLKCIRLNINFIAAYPEFFDHVMRSPIELFFGHTVAVRSHALNITYDTGRINDYVLDQIKDFNPVAAFEELAAHWRLLIAQGNTVIPYIPLEGTLGMDKDTLFPKLRFRSRYGVIEAVRDSEPLAE